MDYLIHIAVIVSIWSILALSLNLIVGYTGLLSITHAAFFGIGAYTTAILSTVYGWNFFITLPIAILCALLSGIVIGAVLSRFKGDYYALVCFGFNTIIWSIMLNWQSLTRGPLGIPGIPRPEAFGIDFSSNSAFFALALL